MPKLSDDDLKELFPYGFALRTVNPDVDDDPIRYIPVPSDEEDSWHAITEFDGDTFFPRELAKNESGYYQISRFGSVREFFPLPEASQFDKWWERV